MPANRISPELHDLHGTMSQANPDAPPAAAGRPRCPKDFSADEKKEFRAACKQLEARRSLTPADGPLIELVAVLRVRHRKALQKVREEGEICTYFRLDSNGQSVPQLKRNLWLDIAEDCEGRITSILDRLGFTPMNRPKVQPTKNAAGDGIVFK